MARHPTLDTLINNAGIMRNLRLGAARDLSDITREIDVNLSGPIRLVQQFLPALSAEGGAREQPGSSAEHVASGQGITWSSLLPPRQDSGHLAGMR